MQHRAVIAATEGVADFIQRRLGKLPREIHRHLPRKGDTGRAPLAGHIGYANIKMFGYAPLNLIDCDGMARLPPAEYPSANAPPLPG